MIERYFFYHSAVGHTLWKGLPDASPCRASQFRFRFDGSRDRPLLARFVDGPIHGRLKGVTSTGWASEP